MKKLMMLLIAAALIGCTSTSEQAIRTTEDFVSYSLSGEAVEGARVVEVQAQKYFYEPEVIVVNTGERVRIKLESLDTDHGFSIADIGFNLKGKKGEVVEEEFIAPEPGVYTIKCSVYCGMGHSKMQGTLVVK